MADQPVRTRADRVEFLVRLLGVPFAVAAVGALMIRLAVGPSSLPNASFIGFVGLLVIWLILFVSLVRGLILMKGRPMRGSGLVLGSVLGAIVYVGLCGAMMKYHP